MQPLHAWPLAERARIRGVLTDIDDTLTTEGAITHDALAALAALADAGLHVIPVTGRPVGWSEPFALQWPVDAIVAENGAVLLDPEGWPVGGRYRGEAGRWCGRLRRRALMAERRAVPHRVLRPGLRRVRAPGRHGNGRKADFRNVIIVMTTNAGAESLQKRSIGFTDKKEAGDEMADIKRMFTPEFRNRLDATISFRALDEEIILRVVDKFLMQLEEQLHEKKVEAVFSDNLRTFLARKGFDPLMGARPMSRLIQDMIRKALADELLFGKLMDGGRVTVDLDEKEQIKLEFFEGDVPPAASTPEAVEVE